MSDHLTLLTSDTPPVALSASRVALVSTLRVFADLLSLPTSTSADSESDSMTLAETEKELKPFLALLQGEEKLVLDVVGWETLARMGDKYDSWAVRAVIKARATRSGIFFPSSRLHSRHRFLGDKVLLTRTGLRALAIENRKRLRFGASEEWKKRLDEWGLDREAYALKSYKIAFVEVASLQSRLSTSHDVHYGRCLAPFPGDVTLRLARALAVFKPYDSVLVSPDSGSFSFSDVCLKCKAGVEAILQKIESLWKRAPPFPL